jgi:hypothetical protein
MNLHKGNKWKTLLELGATINPVYTDLNQINLEYIEISNIQNGRIKVNQAKSKKSSRICKKGDILFSSLTPTKKKIIISNDAYKLSTAIFVVHFDDEKIRDKVFKYFQENDDVYNDMSAFLDGFKITYAKINEFNLGNNIYLDTSKF